MIEITAPLSGEVTEAWGDMLGLEGATFSNDESYSHRYRLWRIWDSNVQVCLFLMLNPSTATERQLDPTVRRCVRWAQSWGYGGLVVCNLYAYRATRPKDMDKADDPVGLFNDWYIKEESLRAGRVVCAWGVHKDPVKGRVGHVLGLLQNVAPGKLYALALTKDGQPGHPLYIPNSAELVPYGRPE